MLIQALGGPLNGEWLDVDPAHQVIMCPESRPSVRWSRESPDPIAEMPRDVTYTMDRFIVPGWRFPLWMLRAPGVRITQTWQHDHMPNPLVVGVCRCDVSGWPVKLDVARSACHLDHCPRHGRPMFEITAGALARATWTRIEWLAEQPFSGWIPFGYLDSGTMNADLKISDLWP